MSPSSINCHRTYFQYQRLIKYQDIRIVKTLRNLEKKHEKTQVNFDKHLSDIRQDVFDFRAKIA